MSGWSSGYVSDVDYPPGYFRELSPALLSLALLAKGISAVRPLRYLELGFGHGLSLNIHAAACGGEFWGTDFNPAFAADAKELAEASGADLHILDMSFQELAARDDSLEFDIIALHGIWSWISDDCRAAILDLAKRKLTAGGILYISYNCEPGCFTAAPLRHLMSLHADFASSAVQTSTAKIDGAIAFAQKAIDSGAAHFRANPAAAHRLQTIKGEDRNYLAHEYFNKYWRPAPFSEIAGQLDEGAKLQFSSPARFLDLIDEMCLTPDGARLVADASHPVLKETLRDYLLNRQFRWDIFVKGARVLAPSQRLSRLRNMSFVLVTQPANVPRTFQAPIGEATLSAAVYEPLLEILAEEGHTPKEIAQIEAHRLWGKRPLPELIQALLVLVACGHVYPAQSPETIQSARRRTRELNNHIRRQSRDAGGSRVLASPILGVGIEVSRINQLFLSALQENKEPASFSWDILSANGEQIVKDGKPLIGREQNIAELTAQANLFAEKTLPILAAIDVA